VSKRFALLSFWFLVFAAICGVAGVVMPVGTLLAIGYIMDGTVLPAVLCLGAVVGAVFVLNWSTGRMRHHWSKRHED